MTIVFWGPYADGIAFVEQGMKEGVWRDKSADTQLDLTQAEVMANDMKRFILKESIHGQKPNRRSRE